MSNIKKLMMSAAGGGEGIDVSSVFAIEQYEGNGNQVSAAGTTRKGIFSDYQLSSEVIVNGFSNDTTKEAIYTTTGTYSWTCPAGVTSVCVVCVGGGAGNAGGGAKAGGGGLGWKNDIPVTPGSSYTVVVGRAGPTGWQGGGGLNNGGDSYFINTSTVAGFGGKGYGSGDQGGGYVGDGGGSGGKGTYNTGGGAGGYLGNGGYGREHQNGCNQTGKGGGGSGAPTWASGNNGGGVGIYGAGASGTLSQPYHGSVGNGAPSTAYGWGEGGSSGAGGGAVRIIWGSGRKFPYSAGYVSELKEEITNCLVWLKSKDSGSRDHYLAHQTADTGGFFQPGMNSNQSYEQSVYADFLNAKSSGGVDIMHSTTASQNQNQTSEDYVAWLFKKKEKFFDIVEWTGDNSTNRAIAHDLGSTPGCIIIKRKNAADGWYVHHRYDYTKYGFLNSPNTFQSTNSGTYFGSTAPNSTHFYLGQGGNGNNANGYKYVAYVFAHNNNDGVFGANQDEDAIKCGNYTGNFGINSISLGFEPQWLMIKNTTDAGSNWEIYDNHRGVGNNTNSKILEANRQYSENDSGDLIQFDADGFSFTGWSVDTNYSGSNYIYVAIRRNGMVEPTTRTEVFRPLTGSSPFAAGFYPVDLGIQKNYTTTGNWYMFNNKCGQDRYLFSNGRDIEASAATQDLANINGWGGSSWGSQSNSLSFKRAKGFFDIVTWEVDGTGNQTIPHSLGVIPEMVWTKNRKSNGFGDGSWFIAHNGLTGWNSSNENDRHVFQDWGTGASAQQGYHRDFTDTSIRLMSNAAGGYNTSHFCVGFLFATLPGISKVGSFTHTYGTALNVDCGFTNGCSFLMLKRYDSSGSWRVYDSARGITSGNDSQMDFGDTAGQDNTANQIDLYSAGFGMRANYLASGDYIFYAIAA